MAKRKAEDDGIDPTPPKKPASEPNGKESSKNCFRKGLFEEPAVVKQRGHYDASSPYKHGVISDLIVPTLLRQVRIEIQDNLSFTPKETDIYKIHQSGDLANLDGLDDASLKLLPALRQLRDALYSPDFRSYLCDVTSSATVSGQKTDMAINVYTPGCHLLCHDDVIGTRRISYILYLTDPDKPWQDTWGGALRLYPTETLRDKEGHDMLLPSPYHTVSVPPAFNQLGFFAVQPGQSFHDVEEVYSRSNESDGEADDVRTRLAISGWYHIPQDGEEGHVEGEEASIAQKSSLSQLQGTAVVHDRPQPGIVEYLKGWGAGTRHVDDSDLSEADLDHLLKYISPTYLTPDTLDSVSSTFSEDCSITLDQFLSKKFSQKLLKHVQSLQSEEETNDWDVARPPHKQRFLYQRTLPSEYSPFQGILKDLIPSKAFQKWLHLATGLQSLSHDSMVRRFRRGQDYTLAQSYEKEEPRLEICLAMTPSAEVSAEDGISAPTRSETHVAGEADAKEQERDKDVEEAEKGGYLAYMAGDDANEEDEEGSDHGVQVPADMSTGARATKARKTKSDPAIYQAQDDEDDAVLFTMPVGWNKLGIVLRDQNTLRFVKYLSRSASSDRWDIVGEFEIEPPDDDSSNEDAASHQGDANEDPLGEEDIDDDDDDGSHETKSSDESDD